MSTLLVPPHTSWPDFETAAKSQREDEIRANILKKSKTPAGRKLAEILTDCASGKMHRTLASSVWFRQLRIKVISRLFEKTADVPDSSLTFFTIIHSAWKIPQNKLHNFDPTKIRDSFRQYLLRRRILKLEGILFASVHGEYQKSSGLFDLHIHGIASSDIGKAINQLPKNYTDKSPDKNRKPLKCLNVNNRAKVYTYLFQSWWPMKERKGRNNKTRYRIPASQLEIYLGWMDQQNAGDLIISNFPVFHDE